ncbi:GIN domain-containing protein, partial [Klebsiella aerogenes]|uniref:GIN domain-containing protein n=3 Tax=Pseudomonadota TaxID=1224 RepID=UPI00195398B2
VMVTGFDRLRIDGPFAVEVAPGSPGVTIAGDRAALDRVAVRVEAGTLVINSGTQSWESAAGKIASDARIRVTVP